MKELNQSVVRVCVCTSCTGDDSVDENENLFD